MKCFSIWFCRSGSKAFESLSVHWL